MDKFETAKIKFEQLRKERPSIIRVTTIYGPLGWIARIVAMILFLAGVAFVVSSASEVYIFKIIFKEINTPKEALSQVVFILQGIIGILFFVISIVLAVMGSLCRSIIKRNFYIMDLEELFEGK